MEEEQFIAAIILDFERGFLDIPAGFHLRKFISSVLNCEHMRISKKFKGTERLGKKVLQTPSYCSELYS